MNHTTTTRRLGAALGLTAFCLAAVAGTAPAQAKSGDMSYQCAIVPLHGNYNSEGTYTGPGEPLSDPQPMTARFDSPLEDGAKVRVGTELQIAPVKGSYTLSPALVKDLLDYAGDTPARGTASVAMTGMLDNARLNIDLAWEDMPYALAAGSPATLTGTGAPSEGDPTSFEVREGAHEFRADDLFVALRLGDDLSAYLACTPQRGTSTLIDRITGVAATSTTAPAPARPSVVQTDAAQPTSPSWVPLAAGAGSILVLGAASVTARRRAAHR